MLCWVVGAVVSVGLVVVGWVVSLLPVPVPVCDDAEVVVIVSGSPLASLSLGNSNLFISQNIPNIKEHTITVIIKLLTILIILVLPDTLLVTLTVLIGVYFGEAADTVDAAFGRVTTAGNLSTSYNL